MIRIILLIIAAVALLPSIANAEEPVGGSHWARKKNPFIVYMQDDLSSRWKPYLPDVAKDWSASSVLGIRLTDGSIDRSSCRHEDGLVVICNYSYGSNDWLGLTDLWMDGNHIIAARVRLNDTYFKKAKYDTSTWKKSVLCHEVGHTLGLDHQDEDFYNQNLGTCLDYSANPKGNTHPNQQDFDQLESIYAHLDTTTTIKKPSTALYRQSLPAQKLTIEYPVPR